MNLSKTINQLINQLVSDVVLVSTQKEVNKLIGDFYTAMQSLNQEHIHKLVKVAVDRAMKMGLSKQDAINVAHISNIITSHFNKDGGIVRVSYDIAAAFDALPRNITRDVKGVVNAYRADRVKWASDKQHYMELAEMVKKMGIQRKYIRNYKTLQVNYLRQSTLDARFKKLDEHEAVMYVARGDVEKRSELCHVLHGTVWQKKADVLEWQKPLLHINCRCELVTILDTVTTKTYDKNLSIAENKANGVIIVKCDSNAGKYAAVMHKRGGNKVIGGRRYGIGHSNFQKIKENGICYYTYITNVKK